VSDTTPQTGLERASGQAEHRYRRTVEDVVVEVLVQRRDDWGTGPQPYADRLVGTVTTSDACRRTNYNSALIATATRTAPERTPFLPEVRTEPATGRGGAGVPRPRRSE